jgi:hypothetical protein
MRKFLAAATLLALALPLAARPDEKKPDEPKPADLPLKAKLVAKKDTYKLDLDGKSGEEFRKILKDAEKAGKVPAPPTVDMVLEITNTSDQEVKFWVEGDANELLLDVKGPNAVSLTPLKAFTADFRASKVITLAAGKTHSIPITSLQYGFRGVSKYSYWTEPGEYTVTASYKTAISPAPKGSKEADKGFGFAVVATTEPVKVKVEAPK